MCSKFALIGKDIQHSLSPLIYEFLYKMYEINAKYCLLDIESEEGIVPYIWRMNEFGYVGFNITSPYKCSVLKYAGSLGENVNAIGAANVIARIRDSSIAMNTDFEGLNHIFKMHYLTGSNALIFGAGGVARAAIYSLLKNNIGKIFICNRTIKNAIAIEKLFDKCQVVTIDDPILYNQRFSVIINAVENNIHAERIVKLSKAKSLICDLIYREGARLIDFANFGQCEYVSGGEVLIYQAMASFEKWFGFFPIDAKDQLRNKFA